MSSNEWANEWQMIDGGDDGFDDEGGGVMTRQCRQRMRNLEEGGVV